MLDKPVLSKSTSRLQNASLTLTLRGHQRTFLPPYAVSSRERMLPARDGAGVMAASWASARSQTTLSAGPPLFQPLTLVSPKGLALAF